MRLDFLRASLIAIAMVSVSFAAIPAAALDRDADPQLDPARAPVVPAGADAARIPAPPVDLDGRGLYPGLPLQQGTEVVVYGETFDANSAPGWTLTGLWHVSACQSSTPTYSLAYNKVGCPTDYDTGTTNSGTATSPSVAISGAGPVFLKYMSRSGTECGGVCSWDKRYVQVSTNGGPFTTVFEEGDTGFTARVIDISAFAPPGSSIRVRFLFESVDDFANSFEGWYVDTVGIDRAPVPNVPCPIAGPGDFVACFDGGAATGWALAGLWHPTNCKAASLELSLGYNKQGCPTNFDVGTTSGAATSPPIPIPPNAGVNLRYQSLSQTECGGVCSYDKRIVQVSTNGGTFANVFDDGDSSTFAQRVINIGAQAPGGSTIQLRFLFSSGDDIANAYEGWYVDNVHVDVIPDACPAAPPLGFLQCFDNPIPAPGWTLGGLWHASTCKAASAPTSLAYNKPGCPTDFDVGTTSGNADSPSLTIPAGYNKVTLQFNSFSDTECISTCSYDRREVYVSANAGPFSLVHSEPDGGWSARSIDISSAAPPGSSIVVRFRFDSIDSIGNAYEGWYVDDVRLTVQDLLAPTVGITTNCSLPGNPGWCRSSSYTYSMTASDAGTGLAPGQPVCKRDGAAAACAGGVGGQGPHSVRIDAADNAGNSAFQEKSLGIDSVAPGIGLASRTPANAAGWNNGPVTVVWNCTDATSGAVAPTVTNVVSGEGAGQSASGTCSDVAGNSASATEGSIHIDLTDPVASIALSGTLGDNGWYTGPVTVTVGCSDALSGVAPPIMVSVNGGAGSPYVAQFVVSDEGVTNVAATCTDVADNSATESQDVHIDSVKPAGKVSTPFASTGWYGVNWDAKDPTSGVAGVEIQERALFDLPEVGSGWATVCTYTFAGLPTINGACAVDPAPGQYCYRIVVTDKAGHSYESSTIDLSDRSSVGGNLTTCTAGSPQEQVPAEVPAPGIEPVAARDEGN